MEYKKTENKYTVATYCFTYNQESYIEDTLNGFSKQETTFPVVYIVIDDASTDRTPEVLCTWCNNNLSSFKLFNYIKCGFTSNRI